MIATPSVPALEVTCSLSADETCLNVLQTVVSERQPFQTVVLLGGGCCDGQRPLLVDKLVINGHQDKLLGVLAFGSPLSHMPVRGIEVYAAPTALPGLSGSHLQFQMRAITEGQVSDSFSLEVPHGVELHLHRQLLG